MVRLLWLLLEEGKHVKGVQGVRLHNSDCQWYVLLKQCLLARSLFNLIIFPKDRSIRHVDTRDTSQNWLWKEYLLRIIFKSFVIGLPIIFFNLLQAQRMSRSSPGRWTIHVGVWVCQLSNQRLWKHVFQDLIDTWRFKSKYKAFREMDKAKKVPEWLSNELLKQCHWYY